MTWEKSLDLMLLTNLARHNIQCYLITVSSRCYFRKKYQKDLWEIPIKFWRDKSNWSLWAKNNFTVYYLLCFWYVILSGEKNSHEENSYISAQYRMMTRVTWTQNKSQNKRASVFKRLTFEKVCESNAPSIIGFKI